MFDIFTMVTTICFYGRLNVFMRLLMLHRLDDA